MDHPQLIEQMFEHGVLLNRNLLEQKPTTTLLEKIEVEADLLVLNEDYMGVLAIPHHLVDWYELDQHRVDAEKDRNDELYQNQLQSFRRLTTFTDTPSTPPEASSLGVELSIADSGTTYSAETTSFQDPDLTSALDQDQLILPENTVFNLPSPAITSVLISYENIPRKYEIKDFTSWFASRYQFLSGILRQHQELHLVLPVSRVLQKKEKESISIIGIVSDISVTKNGNIMVALEDPTGIIKAVFSQNKKELFTLAKELVLDEVVGVSGFNNEGFIFAEGMVWPDLPGQELKKDPHSDEYAIFLSDIHVGSALFLKSEFTRFLEWINGNIGDEKQRVLASKVRYIFLVGDLVDGVGVYPLQEAELEIKDIAGQYRELARLLKKIPTNKDIIICPGNHDVIHLAEPQPLVYKEYAAELYQLPNITSVTNPAWINIGKTATFSGFDVLMYHGYSFDYYVANVESIRNQGGYHRADLIMKFLLKRRHLAPSFRSTPYFPGYDEDPLLIKKIPDFLVTGHIHYSYVANYKSVTMISCSCWQGKTTFQEKLGHDPEPARVPLVNLRTREVKILRF